MLATVPGRGLTVAAVETHHPRGTDVCIDCGQHVDARIHHTPRRLSGEHGPAIGARMAQNPLHEGATLLAAALRPNRHIPWGPLAGAAQEALRDLQAAGWTAPGGAVDDENAKLRAALEQAQMRVDNLNGHLDRARGELAALEEFRHAVVGVALDPATAGLPADAAPRFNGRQVRDLFGELLAKADRAAESARKRQAKQAADWAARAGRAQQALFGVEPAPAVQDVAVAGGVL